VVQGSVWSDGKPVRLRGGRELLILAFGSQSSTSVWRNWPYMSVQVNDPWGGRLLGVFRDTHPHWVVDCGRYAVTLRCCGSLPDAARWRLREIGAALEAVDPASEEAETYRRRHFAILERALDRASGFCPFRDREAAAGMAAFLENYDFDGLAFARWVVMPNHLHLITEQ